MRGRGKWIISSLAAFMVGALAGVIFAVKQNEKHCELLEKNLDQFSEFYTLTQQWVHVYQEDRTLESYFKKNGYRKIAVYGMGDMACMLENELEESCVDITYFIDKNADNLFAKRDIRKPDGDLPAVDVVVVTVVQYYDEVKENLERKMSCPIVSLTDIVWEA